MCWICRQEVPPAKPGKKRADVCSRRCAIVRKAVYQLLRQLTAMWRCRICRADALEGSRYCGRHQWRREPCPCGAPIRRTEGAGRDPERCTTCRAKAKQAARGMDPQAA